MNIDNLKNFKIFDGLSDTEVKLFTEKIKPKSYAKNKMIMKEGEFGHSILFLLSGEISVTKSLTLSTNKDEAKDNREKEFIRYKAQDNIIIGEVSLFSNDHERTASAKALIDSNIGAINKKDFFDICNANNEVGYKVLKNLIGIITEKLIDTNHQVLKLTTAFSLVIDN